MDIGRADSGSINGLPFHETHGSVRVIVVCVIQNKSLSPPATSKTFPVQDIS